MRPFLFSICALLLLQITAFSQSILRFKSSKPYAVFSFMETASGTHLHSTTLQAYIDSVIGHTDTTFNSLLHDFANVNLNYSYRREEYPGGRRQTRSTYDLLVIAAVKSNTMQEFHDNTIGILSNHAHQELFRVLNKAVPYYEKTIWLMSAIAVKDRIAGFKKFEPKANEAFRAFRKLYRSSWPDAIPFEVSVFPVPGRIGNTTATPHANSLCISVLTGSKDHAGTMGVIMHELCHVLYDEQTSDFQQQLDSFFKKSKSPYNDIAYSYFDEAMATALGNGWAYNYFSGKMDTTEWYNNEYIDGFAHALYPMVTKYIRKNKSIDSAFVESAISTFGKTYPRSLNDYAVLLNNMYLYSDAEEREERRKLQAMLGKYFQSSRYHSSSPILHEYSIESIRNSKGTQLIVIDRHQDATIAELKKYLPALDTLIKEREKNFVAAFYDQANRPVIIVCAESSEMIGKGFQLLKETRYLDEINPVKFIK